MGVPKMSQLRPGVIVDMVLKVDQRSGKLTTGQISEILTRGDHPRGIKVRLSSGQVGRVQSLSTSSEQPATAKPMPFVQTGLGGQYESSPNGSAGKRRGRFALQEDYRQDPSPMEPRSLADYIRVPPSKFPHPPSGMAVGDTTQSKLEKEFPKLDSALIAAILDDYEDIKDARGVLSSLS